MRHRIERLAGTLIVLLVAGCASIGTSIGSDHVRWTEEVKLSDGRVIQVQRHVEMTGSGFPVDKRGADKYHEICYPPMGLHWKSRGGYLPDVFDIVDGKAYMHVPISDCFSCERYGYPSTNAVYFTWEQGRWQRIEHEAFPARSEWNLLRQISGGSSKADPKGLVTLDEKTVLDRNMHYEQKRLGWKRVSDSYSHRDRCKKCRGVINDVIGQSLAEFTEILHQNQISVCQ